MGQTAQSARLCDRLFGLLRAVVGTVTINRFTHFGEKTLLRFHENHPVDLRCL